MVEERAVEQAAGSNLLYLPQFAIVIKPSSADTAYRRDVVSIITQRQGFLRCLWGRASLLSGRIVDWSLQGPLQSHRRKLDASRLNPRGAGPRSALPFQSFREIRSMDTDGVEMFQVLR